MYVHKHNNYFSILNMEKVIVFLFVVQMWLVICLTETPDVNIIYNMYAATDLDASFPVDIEIHSMTNSLGKQFRLQNKTVFSPTSSRSIPSFDCFSSFSSVCEWKSNDNWKSSFINNQQLETLSLPINGFNLQCEYNNGGCPISDHCENSSSGPKCTCPSNFFLNDDNTMCSTMSNCNYVLSNDTGEFQSPYYPSDYPLRTTCTWLIITSKEKIIHVEISISHVEDGYDFVTVFDGMDKQIGKWSGREISTDVKSTGNIMLVRFESDEVNSASGFKAHYTTEQIQNMQVPELWDDRGIIKSSLNISHPNLCVSLIYTLPPSGSLELFAEHSTLGKTYFKKVHSTEINGWHISRFLPVTYIGISGTSINLTVQVTGKLSKILNIVECSSDGEDVYVLPNLIWTKNDIQKYANIDTSHLRDTLLTTPGSAHKCKHGGTYDETIGKCICPPGFTGSNCTEACGSNRYGHNCSGECSWFENGCRMMIFCNTIQTCSCATGFTGIYCENECLPGTYGANCLNSCGNCKEGSCDIYTGECNAQCEEGFYPPLCQDRYTFLRQAPVVMETSWNNILISIDFMDTYGDVPPHLYEVQYKEMGVSNWIKTTVEEINSRFLTLVNVTDLRVGTKYLLRVIIICEDGNSYQGSDIPTVEFETLCQIPASNIYEMESRNITSSSFAVSWKYSSHNEKWCPIKSYEVILQERWKTYRAEVSPDEAHKVYSNLLPGYQYTVYVRAITNNGKAPCSSPFTVTTNDTAPEKVKHFKVEQSNARNIHISWKSPLLTGRIIKGFSIHYECTRHFICEESCRNSSGNLNTTEHSVNLTNLLPHAQYKIRVAAYSSSQGPYSELFAATKTTYPTVSPMASEQPIVSKANTTVTIQWQSPHCPGQNGRLTGYYLTLSSETENGQTILQNRTTKQTQTSFTALIPMTEYQIHVYAMNSHGWNANYKLIIPFSSSATVPEAVDDLQVYKKGRRILGIRWGNPTRIYGTLKSFTVSYHQKDTENKVTETVTPTACSGWPNLYCHTLLFNLLPDKQYIVSVAARNSEIDEDGTKSEVHAITRENAPGAPTSLNILKSTSTSFEMQWGLPNMFNGELRSFIVNVEHVESLNDSECCEYFPVQELPLREETPQYNLEVNGLIPASTYIVSVTAKTITLGPSINTTCYTAPLPPTNLQSPQIVGLADDGYSYIIKIQPVNILLNSNSTYLLLVLPPGESPQPTIWKADLLEKLTQTVNESFYIVLEFTRDEFVNEQEVKIGTGAKVRNETLGSLADPKFTPGVYRLGLALVQWYGDAISVGAAISDSFEIGKLPDRK